MSKKNSDKTTYYNDKLLLESSRRGYYEEKLNYIIDFLTKNQISNLKILDIGCNDGELLKKYSEFGDVIGIDISSEAVRASRKKGLKVILTDVENLDKKFNNIFDLVIAGDIIEHVFDTDKFLLNIRRVLKPNGTLILTTPNLASLPRRFMLLLGLNPYIEYSTKLPTEEINVGHIRYYTKSNIFSQLTKRQFKNIKIFGDRINILPSLYIPFSVAKHLPQFARNLIIECQK